VSRCYNKLQLNSELYQERRRGYWPSEASGNLADTAKVPKPARYENGETGNDGAHNRADRSLLEAPPPRGVSSLPLRADQQQARSLLARGKGRVVKEVSTTISWLRGSDPWRGKQHAQSATIMKLAALNVHPRELEADDEA
jgi:hypothetical protein